MPVALVTGGAGGIGGGIANALLDAGYSVVATGVSEAELAAVKPREGLTLGVLDVTDEGSVEACLASLDRLDALVNCAGTIMRGGAEFELANFERVLSVNLTGTMRMCVRAKPLLEESRGAIVNTASMLSFFGGPIVPAYTASKGAVAQLTKSLAVAWAKDGIRVNAIAPGWIETELTRSIAEDESRSSGILSRTPQGRWGRPDDVGGAAVFLLSPQAAFVTGTILPVDGGYAAM